MLPSTHAWGKALPLAEANALMLLAQNLLAQLLGFAFAWLVMGRACGPLIPSWAVLVLAMFGQGLAGVMDMRQGLSRGHFLGLLCCVVVYISLVGIVLENEDRSPSESLAHVAFASSVLGVVLLWLKRLNRNISIAAGAVLISLCFCYSYGVNALHPPPSPPTGLLLPEAMQHFSVQGLCLGMSPGEVKRLTGAGGTKSEVMTSLSTGLSGREQLARVTGDMLQLGNATIARAGEYPSSFEAVLGPPTKVFVDLRVDLTYYVYHFPLEKTLVKSQGCSEGSLVISLSGNRGRINDFTLRADVYENDPQWGPAHAEDFAISWFLAAGFFSAVVILGREGLLVLLH